MTFKIEGLAKAQKAFQKLMDDVPQYAASAVVDVAVDLLGEAVRQAPVDTGDMRGSGLAEVNGTEVAKGQKEGGIKVQRPGFRAKSLTATIGFYGLPYTVRQHEDTTLNHPQGGNAKFLETPFKERTPRYIKRLADSIKKAVD